ncbi:MAG: four helix bundle protein [Bacteroidetes bacterium]|nr:four helix bundle protein [Bacteroidota bacterium]MBU1421972.1 four helix bundle protein [Bacteroidota bacterium]MBU2471727.1 four helix bundle protein [Bacteroidota bacterium]
MYKCEELKARTKRFAIEIIKLFRKLPKTDDSRIIGKQVLRSATSVAANYRSACRARSKAEFISKIGIVVEEIDETVFWLEIIFETDIYKSDPIEQLMKEANELLAIFAASQYTAKSREKK